MDAFTTIVSGKMGVPKGGFFWNDAAIATTAAAEVNWSNQK